MPVWKSNSFLSATDFSIELADIGIPQLNGLGWITIITHSYLHNPLPYRGRICYNTGSYTKLNKIADARDIKKKMTFLLGNSALTIANFAYSIPPIPSPLPAREYFVPL
jgi:hypothetical protein